MIIAKANEGGNRYVIPAGTYQGVCYAVWDIGNQLVEYKDTKKIQNKIIIAWELNHLIPDGEYKGKRAVITRKYTLSLADKASLKKDLQNWRGKAFTEEELKGFDVEKLIGANCMISVINSESNGNTYANVGSISKLMTGIEKIVPENNSNMPEWVVKLKEQSVSQDQDVEVYENNDEEIPF